MLSDKKIPNTMDDVLLKLVGWYKNPPDFSETELAYKKLGQLNASITKKKREIEAKEEAVTMESDKPTSNAAKQKKLQSTAQLRNELAELQAQKDIQESEVKFIEFRKTMFQSSIYASKVKLEL